MTADLKHITIIGIGLIGSSLALALKQRGFTGTITGVGRKEENLKKAKELGIIDDYTTGHADGVKKSDLILLATPVGHFTDVISKMIPAIRPGAVITDVGSVKADVVEKMESLIPENIFFVGGHPIAGSECHGLEGAKADLFEDARCILTPTARTSKTALEAAVELWTAAGAKTSFMSPEEHDLIFAAVSHMPHVAAYALVNAIVDVKSNILQYSGSGLRDMTRIAMSPPELWSDICSANRENILATLKKFSRSLTRLTGLIEEADWKTLEREFKKAGEARKQIDPD